MAHEITSTDSLFSVRQPTWHQLGEILTDYPTRAEAQRLVHPWEPVTEPLFTRNVGIDFDVMAGESKPYERFEEIEGHKAVRRSDDGALLGVVGSNYEPVTNTELWDIAEALQADATDVKFETAGSLKGGANVWILIRLEEPLQVDGDPRGATIPYYALQNSHDGTGSFRGQATMTRIVCANTSKAADLDARSRGTEFTFRHTKNVGERVEEARQALTGWRASLEQWRALSRHLLTVEMSHDDTLAFLDRWLPIPEAGVASERVRRNASEARAEWFGSLNSVTCEGIADTAYGVLQASIEYAEHLRAARTVESRFKRAYLDRSEVVQHAAQLLTA